MAESTETDAEQVMCRLGHLFEPGIDMDDPEHPDPRWCNVCGTVAGPAPEPTEGSFVPVLPGYYEEVARRLAATGGVPDEPGDDDPKGWAKRVRSNLTEVLDAEEVERWAGMDEPGVQRFRLLAASHEKLRAEVERLRTATGSECEVAHHA